jgi:uncharacterized membrane protein YraQ (UPF0718 family)
MLKAVRSILLREKALFLRVLFPVSVLGVYGIILYAMPDMAFLAVESCGKAFYSMLFPLCGVFVLLVLVNLFLKPNQINRFLGKGAGIKGYLFAAIAGIISMGPVFAWYPLLEKLKEKGATHSLIAVFLGNRAVKPFLLPVMIAYFGWAYTIVFTILTILSGFVLGYFLNLFLENLWVTGPAQSVEPKKTHKGTHR